ncbi:MULTISPECIES: sec-independent translocase [unclassified Luteococcus]|uniref:sec-independent translocase n=1 Tax=unclassified Luteococcus TaxID=2639923 RepID=UPI00313C16FE
MPGIQEFLMLAVLATIMFGPEKIPELSRKAARIVFFLRNIANTAQDQLRAELGPEYANLDIRDLHPKTFIQKHLLEDMQSDIDEIKSDLSDVRSDLDSDLKDAKMLGQDLQHQLESKDADDQPGMAGVGVPDYADAT